MSSRRSARGRYADRNDRKPMIQVFAKFAFGDQRLEITRR